MRYLGFCISLLLVPGFALSQDSVMLRFGNTVNRDDLKRHLSVLASDEYEGRETGMKGQQMAAKYIENEFRVNGLMGVVNGAYQQEFPILMEKAGSSGLNLAGKAFQFISDFFYVGNYKEGKIENSEIVFVGYGIEADNYNDYKGVDVNGKIVAYLDGVPKDKKGAEFIKGENSTAWGIDRTKKIKLAQEKGAVGILVVTADYEKKVAQYKSFIMNTKVRLNKPVEGDKKVGLPTFYISEAVADNFLMINKLSVKKAKEKIGKTRKPLMAVVPVRVELDIKKDVKEGSSTNVLGYVEGSDLKDELVVISAHYDHIGMNGTKIFNGADDDGSGTVAVIELAQAFALAKEQGKGPRRSLLFITVSGEEKGLLGSEYYTDYPIFPLKNTVCDLNIDMIGRQDKKYENNPNYVYVIGSDKLSTELHNINEDMNGRFGKLTLDYTYNAPTDPNRYYYRSDHYNFAKNNIPVIFYFNGTHEDYHQETDEVEKINFDKMEKITRLVFYTAWNVANRNERLKVDKVNDFK